MTDFDLPYVPTVLTEKTQGAEHVDTQAALVAGSDLHLVANRMTIDCDSPTQLHVIAFDGDMNPMDTLMVLDNAFGVDITATLVLCLPIAHALYPNHVRAERTD